MKRFTLYFLSALIALTVTADRLIKIYFLARPDISWGWSFFNFRFWQNKSLAFTAGNASAAGWLISFLIILILLFLLWQTTSYCHKKQDREVLLLTAIILGGASNLFDRLVYGGVIDYINFNFWPIFNLADILITLGTVGFLFVLLRDNAKIKI